ncbi:MAG: T9SS type A sorting domain-containing protein, partial [Candidatus Krumholzibacteria bacterium]|nr:T9SS type A sorting domain-containing protein [Candidatus Krumholzibacteria bacterium]
SLAPDFEPGSEPFEGQVAECRVEFLSSPHGLFWDTCLVWIDPTPPIPNFTFFRDSIIIYDIDSFFDIMYEVEDELPAPGLAELQAFPLTQRFERTLTTIDQLGLGTDLDSVSCGPTSAASCLKYFADNGYPGLDNPGGDEAKPEQSGEDIARELQGAMGTNDSTGTSSDGMVSGIENYLEGHGQSGWSVSSHPVDNATDLAAMFREFEADSEDVLVCLQDTSAAGDTMGHWVTMGSREQTQHSADSTSQKIDFMDPWGGGSTADNNYDIGEDENGKPTTEGYDLDGAGGSAKIAGYIKVSPPEGGSSSSGISRAPRSPSFDPHWIQLDTGLVTGNGVEDTLHWDTSGFMPGLYLMEVSTTNHQGITCRDLRMVLLIDPTTDSDPGTPGVKTGLQGTYPNPFNPTTTIAYSIEKGGPVTLTVYDIAGRRVRTLLNAKMTEAGSYTVTWDGLDDRGNNVSSGVYFCRFSSGETDSSTKMILLR